MKQFKQYLGKPTKEGKTLMVKAEQFAQTTQLMLNDLAEKIETLEMENRVHKRMIDFIMENVEFGNETTVRSIKELYNKQL